MSTGQQTLAVQSIMTTTTEACDTWSLSYIWQRDWIFSVHPYKDVTMPLKMNEYRRGHSRLSDACICMRC